MTEPTSTQVAAGGLAARSILNRYGLGQFIPTQVDQLVSQIQPQETVGSSTSASGTQSMATSSAADNSTSSSSTLTGEPIDSTASSAPSTATVDSSSSNVNAYQVDGSSGSSSAEAGAVCAAADKPCEPKGDRPTSCTDQDYTCQVTLSCWPCYTDRSFSYCPTCVSMQRCNGQLACQLPLVCQFCTQLKANNQALPQACTAAASTCNSSTGAASA